MWVLVEEWNCCSFPISTEQQGAVIGVDIVDEMLAACAENIKEAEELNPWFKENYITLLKGDALNLPVEDQCVDVAAQNSLV